MNLLCITRHMNDIPVKGNKSSLLMCVRKRQLITRGSGTKRTRAASMRPVESSCISSTVLRTACTTSRNIGPFASVKLKSAATLILKPGSSCRARESFIRMRTTHRVLPLLLG